MRVGAATPSVARRPVQPLAVRGPHRGRPSDASPAHGAAARTNRPPRAALEPPPTPPRRPPRRPVRVNGRAHARTRWRAARAHIIIDISLGGRRLRRRWQGSSSVSVGRRLSVVRLRGGKPPNRLTDTHRRSRRAQSSWLRAIFFSVLVVVVVIVSGSVDGFIIVIIFFPIAVRATAANRHESARVAAAASPVHRTYDARRRSADRIVVSSLVRVRGHTESIRPERKKTRVAGPLVTMSAVVPPPPSSSSSLSWYHRAPLFRARARFVCVAYNIRADRLCRFRYTRPCLVPHRRASRRRRRPGATIIIVIVIDNWLRLRAIDHVRIASRPRNVLVVSKSRKVHVGEHAHRVVGRGRCNVSAGYEWQRT